MALHSSVARDAPMRRGLRHETSRYGIGVIAAVARDAPMRRGLRHRHPTTRWSGFRTVARDAPMRRGLRQNTMASPSANCQRASRATPR